MGDGLPGETLARISDAVTTIWVRRHGHGPTSTKSYAFDEFVVTVLRGGFTAQERTLLDSGHEPLVRQMRSAFERELCDDFAQMMREITGRELVDYHSQVLVRTRTTVEVFVLAPES